jgi:hypothetical protein
MQVVQRQSAESVADGLTVSVPAGMVLSQLLPDGRSLLTQGLALKEKPRFKCLGVLQGEAGEQLPAVQIGSRHQRAQAAVAKRLGAVGVSSDLCQQHPKLMHINLEVRPGPERDLVPVRLEKRRTDIMAQGR